MIRTALFFVTCLLLVGCGEQPAPPVRHLIPVIDGIHAPEIERPSGWKIKKEGEFFDEQAYGNYRQIFRFTAPDGTEYVGVTGVGISEVGSHPAGKVRITDER